MMERKYELVLDDTILTDTGVKLFRIKALRDFGSVEKGMLGGYIEKEENLSHRGHSWVFHNAQVFNNAEVLGNAQVLGNARVYGNSQVCCEARVYHSAQVYDNAQVSDRACVYDAAQVYGISHISDNARVYDNAQIYGEARVYDNARVYNDAKVYDNARVHGNSDISDIAQIYGNAQVSDRACVYDAAQVYGNARVLGVVIISNRAIIKDVFDYIVIGPIGSRADFTTFFKTARSIRVRCGCFNGNIKKFESEVKQVHEKNELYLKQYLGAIELAKSTLI